MKSAEIRKKFLKYFESKGHKMMPSASLIPSDPTVLLTLAGMLPFKPYFLGLEKSPSPKMTSVQKCIRMNDIENVGRTSRHHTFFEMLGNFSFGDYFKKEAIEFAWDLLTREFKLPADKLVIAVFKDDDEAAGIWEKEIGVPKDRIYRLDEENNFWAAGPTGPCGPCSEIYYDYGKEKGCGKPNCDPSCDCERWLEVWNLVFIQFNCDEAGKLNPLPKKNIDTGMGLERISRLLQDVETNFDTDLFKPIIDKLPKGNVSSQRIIADHLRAATFLIADGVTPSNEGRGYVLRRIIRRAVLHGKKLGQLKPFLFELAGIVISNFGDAYPELKQRSSEIKETLKREEDNFHLTLESGMKLAQELIKSSGKVIPGAEVFKLYDTYGFPIEITREIAKEQGAELDESGYLKAMEEQKKRARQAGAGESILHKLDLSKYPKTNFIGYDKSETEARVLAVFPEDKIIILDKTPFYPESGGQIGDTGMLTFDKKEVIVTNTFGRVGGVILHQVDDVNDLKEKKNVKARIDESRRKAILAHHSATHLLHSALRKILGEGATQAGSFVGPDRLRFDFNFNRALTHAEVESIEKMVNEDIKKAVKSNIFETSLEDAKKQGAVALFGEKYHEKVRVVKFPDISMELCGGCHVKDTGEIQFFKINKEEALSAGVRRIEAMVGPAAKVYLVYQGKALKDAIFKLMLEHQDLDEERVKLGGEKRLEESIFAVDQQELDSLKRAADALDIVNVNKYLEHLKGRLEWARERNRTLEKEIAKLKEHQLLAGADEVVKGIKEIKGIKLIERRFEGVPMSMLRTLSDDVRKKMGSGVIIFASVVEGKVYFLVTVSDDLTAKYNAGDLVKILAQTCGGGGGGKANKAEAGGKDVSKVDEALEKALASL